MSERKSKETAKELRPYAEFTPRPRKKPRPPRVRLTHLEVHRGDTLRLRIAVADDALAEVGDELGALLKKIAPSTRTAVVSQPIAAPQQVVDFLVSQQHGDDDETYHANLREHLTGFFGTLCDTSLADALEIARQERDRRAEGSN
jgi:hypothetical protein